MTVDSEGMLTPSIKAPRGRRPISRVLGGPRIYARRTILLGLVLALVLAAMASAVLLSQRESQSRIRSNFELRGDGAATFISTFLADQAARMRETGSGMLSGARVPMARLRVAGQALGSDTAVLLGVDGRRLGAVSMTGKPAAGPIMAGAESELRSAEQGRVTISNLIPSDGRGGQRVTISVPFSTPHGRRVLSIAYPVQGSALGAFVKHTLTYRRHQVLLLDAHDRLLAASPETGARTFHAAAPRLERAAARSSHGVVGSESTFTTAAVAGTPWRLVLGAPDSILYASIDGWEARVPWIVFALVSIFGISLLALFSRSLSDRARLWALSATLEETAQTDALTGLYNRRALTERFVRAASQARRREQPLSVLMIDLDHFKQTNDRYGHDAGDRVLRTFADCMRRAGRKEDIYGRWGGDEFLAALPATDESSAMAVAERLREAAAERELPDIGLPDGVQFSVGVASGLRMPPDLLAQMADEALYESKAGGRGRTAVARQPDAAPTDPDTAPTDPDHVQAADLARIHPSGSTG